MYVIIAAHKNSVSHLLEAITVVVIECACVLMAGFKTENGDSTETFLLSEKA